MKSRIRVLPQKVYSTAKTQGILEKYLMQNLLAALPKCCIDLDLVANKIIKHFFHSNISQHNIQYHKYNQYVHVQVSQGQQK